METEKLIFKKIAKINQEIGAIGKTEENKAQRFNFRGIDSVYNALHDLLAKHEVFSTSEILEQSKEEKPSRNGGNLMYRVFKILYRFHTTDGSYVETQVMGEAMDSGDKAASKAMAIAHKYALLQMFTIPTEGDKDPDFDTPDPLNKAYPDPKKQGQGQGQQKNNQKTEKLNLGKKLCINLICKIYTAGPEKEAKIKQVNQENSVEKLRAIRSELIILKDKLKTT